jgi:hypothetical protein
MDGIAPHFMGNKTALPIPPGAPPSPHHRIIVQSARHLSGSSSRTRIHYNCGANARLASSGDSPERRV